jgi:hypothetical protein
LSGVEKACYWSCFEAKLQPVLTIESGDEIAIGTIGCGPEVAPGRSRFHVQPNWPRFMLKANGCAELLPDRAGRSQ